MNISERIKGMLEGSGFSVRHTHDGLIVSDGNAKAGIALSPDPDDKDSTDFFAYSSDEKSDGFLASFRTEYPEDEERSIVDAARGALAEETEHLREKEEKEEKAMRYYNVALMEKQLDEGLSLPETVKLFRMLSGAEAIPIEIQGESSVAMGFINLTDAEFMSYDYSGLEGTVKDVLNDAENEDPDGEYEVANGSGVTTVKIIRNASDAGHRDEYRAEAIESHIKASKDDPYYLAQVSGPAAKNIKLDALALETLLAYM